MKHDIFCVKDRVTIITGGMGQLGRQFAFELLGRGARVAIFDAHIDENYVKERFPEHYLCENILFVKVDVTSRNSIINALDKVIDKWQTPYALVNNAALDTPPNASADENGPFEQYPEESWVKVLDVNLKGVLLCCQVIGERMAEKGRGSIINISSIYGVVSPDQRIYEYRRVAGQEFYKPVSYSVSKSAILNLTRYLATYWASKGVRVNTLTFGGVFNKQDNAFLAGYCNKVPLGRMARESEYNGAIVFLISDAASYMTGANLILDGGYTSW